MPLSLTSTRLITLRPSFWLTLKGAEAGQDDESQRKEKNLKGEEAIWALGTTEKEGSINRGWLRLSGFGKQGWVVGVLGGCAEDGRGGGRGEVRNILMVPEHRYWSGQLCWRSEQ